MSAPKGPRLPPVALSDAGGSYHAFPGKSCSVCTAPLTSRNRFGTALLCLPHGREKDAARVRFPRWISKQSKARAMTTTPKPAREPAPDLRCDFQSPQYRSLQSLFTQFMNYPTTDGSSALLVSAMNEYELMARLRQVIPG